jgi:hypothetical protein
LTKNLALPVYSVSGSNYEIGARIGERFRPQIVDFLRKSKRLSLLRKAEKRNPRLHKWIEYGDKCFPQYMQEIRGIADGSNSSLTDVSLINCKYDLPIKRCTTVIFWEPGRVLVAHNEDNTKDNLNSCYLLKVYPEMGIPFISFCYPAMITPCALKENELPGIIAG